MPLRHRRTGEWVYVTAGSATAELDGRRVPLRPGDYLYLPAGVWHAFRAGARGVEAISVFLPGMEMGRPDVEIRRPR